MQASDSTAADSHTASATAAPANRALRVLVLDEELPWPVDSGKRVRTWNLLRRLARQHSITLLCYGDPSDPAVNRVREAGIAVEIVPNPPRPRGLTLFARLFLNLFSPYPFSVDKHFTERFRERANRLARAGGFDLVHCEWTPYARFLASVQGLPTLIVTHNIESQIWFRRAAHESLFPGRPFFWLQAAKMKRFEQQALREAGWVTAVSAPDLSTLGEWGVERCSLVENGVDLEAFHPRPQAEVVGRLLFLGSLDWYANQDAAEHFLRNIFPLLARRCPRAVFRVAGRRPPAALVAAVKATPGAELVADVPDVPGEYAQAEVVVVPLRIGGGSRIKILEAMAVGKAVVSTPVGAEGLDVTDGQDIVLAKTPEEFVRRVAELLEAPAERQRIGSNARKLAERKYSWDLAARALEEAWRRAAAQGTMRTP